MKNFEEIQVLGDGGFGTVIKCKDLKSGETVAIKKLKQRYSSFEQCLNENEVKSLRKIKHQNIVKLLQVFRENEHLYLVFELLGDTLFKTISKRSNPFSDEEVRSIMVQVLQGLAVIHKQGFFHRDMKPDNLLWGKDNSLKISDFGLAKEIRSRPPFTEYVSTRWYRAPEIILRHQFYNSPVDIWAVGCIMAELYLLRPIFPGSSDTDQLYKIMGILGPISKNNWPDGVKLADKRGLRVSCGTSIKLSSLLPTACQDAIDLMMLCLQYDPAKRPSANQVLAHRFFQDPLISPLIDNRLLSSPAQNTQKALTSLELQPSSFSKSLPDPHKNSHIASVSESPSKNQYIFTQKPNKSSLASHSYNHASLTETISKANISQKQVNPVMSFGGGTFKTYPLNDSDDDLFDGIF